MASSFPSQIPIIIHLLAKLCPATMLDIGKGFGKYGFLVHEYVGIDPGKRPNPNVSLAQQSRVSVDAVECNENYLWPHICQLYRNVHIGRIEDLYRSLPRYDVVLMADVIEHINKTDGLSVSKHFVEEGSSVIISTPYKFFDQDLYQSGDEHHVSHWTPRDFDWCYHDHQKSDSGVVYLLSSSPVNIRGFGSRPLARARRLVRAVRDCLH
jgi:hypothetical protein